MQKVSLLCALLAAIVWLLHHAEAIERWRASARFAGPLVWTLLATGIVSLTAISAGLRYVLHSCGG